MKIKSSPMVLGMTSMAGLPKKISRHRPKTSSGMVMGRSMMVLTRPLPQYLKRDRLQPTGRTSRITRTVAEELVRSENIGQAQKPCRFLADNNIKLWHNTFDETWNIFL